MTSYLELRDIALGIARSVAPIPANGQPRLHDARTLAVDQKSTHLDLVTELDRATEAAVLRELAALRPDDGILGEEGGTKVSASGYTWVIDPIDGTVNYFYGQPNWAISIGVVDESGVPVAGVVHAPVLGESYVAARGHGAFLVTNDDTWLRMSPPPDVPMDLALLATGFPYDLERRFDMARAFADFVVRVRDLRRIGSAAIDICNVAMGRIDGYFERDTRPWDRIAATVVVNEVGVELVVHGDPMGHNLVVCAPPKLLRTLTEELARLGVVG